MATIEDIPNEVLIEVFSYLNLRHRKNVRLVCKLWYSLSYTSRLVKGDIFKVRMYEDLDKLVTANSRHTHLSLSLTRMMIRETPSPKLKALNFWKNHGQNVKSLEIDCEDKCLQLLPVIFASCPNVEYLFLRLVARFRIKRRLLRGLYWGTVDLSRLTYIKLVGHPVEALPLLKKIIMTAPNLEGLHLLANCYYYGKSITVNTLLFQVIKLTKKLQDVKFYRFDLNDNVIDNITKVLGPQLRRISIDSSEISDWSLEMMVNRCPNLKELALMHGKFNPNRLLAALQEKDQEIVLALEYKCTRHLSDLADLPNLVHLSLWHINNIELYTALAYKVRPQLTELRMVNCLIDDATVQRILPSLPNLRIFNLSENVYITDGSLEAICKHNAFLECLSLENCFPITRLHFSSGHSINDCSKLIHLNLAGLSLSDECIKRLKLPFLEVLDYDGSMFNDLLVGCRSLKYWNRYRYERGRVSDVVQSKSGRNLSFLKCYNSPFGPCFMNDSSKFRVNLEF